MIRFAERFHEQGLQQGMEQGMQQRADPTHLVRAGPDRWPSRRDSAL